MKPNQLSKREYKYRCKIIAECHLKKSGQECLDNYVRDVPITYKKFYLDEARICFFRAIQSVTKTSDAFKRLSMSIKDLTKSYEKILNTINGG